MKTFIAQGAEAKVYTVEEYGKIVLLKERVPKAYRLPVLDEKLRKVRTRRELSLLEKAAQFIPVPSVQKGGKEEQEKIIRMEFIPGEKLATALDKIPAAERQKICVIVGEK